MALNEETDYSFSLSKTNERRCRQSLSSYGRGLASGRNCVVEDSVKRKSHLLV